MPKLCTRPFRLRRATAGLPPGSRHARPPSGNGRRPTIILRGDNRHLRLLATDLLRYKRYVAAKL
jgi:hypothetical protein